MRKTLLSFILIVLFILISLTLTTLAELYLRYIGLGDPIIYEQNDAYGYSLFPNQEKIRLRNSRVKINSAGLRANKEWVGEKKILFLGDSVTYGGSYIDNSRLFSEQVCDKLKNEVICGNAGVNAYGVLNMVLRSRYDFRLQEAEIVIFTVISGDFTRGITNANVAHYFLNHTKTIFPALEEAFSFIGYKYDINKYISKSGMPASNNLLNDYSTTGSIEFAINTLNEEIMRLEKLGKKVLVFYSPDKSELSSKANISIKNKIISNVNGIIDMTPKFKKGKKLYYDGVHYDNAGHDLVANIIFNHINKEKMLHN